MKKFLFLLFTFLIFLGPSPLMAKESDSFCDKVVVIKVKDDSLTSKQSFDFMNRILKKAEEEQARAVIFDMNTPGGLAWETSEMMMKTLQPLKVPTYSFVNPRAMSAGALISAACDAIYMAPVSSIGAAGIVNSGGEEMDPVMRKKVESAFWAFTRSVVTEKGYRPEVIRAMMIPAENDTDFGEVRVAKDSLLTLTGKEATAIQKDGKPLLAKGTASSLEDLLAQENIHAPIVQAEPTGFESIALWISWASPILILLGIGGLYIEFKTPGFGIGGIVAIIAFSLFFFGNHIAGNLAGYETAALLVVGVALLCLEFFVIPGTFISAILGGICIMMSLFGGMISSWEWDELFRDGMPNADALISVCTPALFRLVLGFAGGLVLILVLMKFLPDAPLFRRISNNSVSGGEKSGEAVVRKKVAIGAIGEAATELRPNGKALFGGTLHEVVSLQGILPKGTPLRVEEIRPFELAVVKYSPHDNS